ncbi:MAG TPA: tRNA (adenosine(37)-N6)-threonylcarbamoyltransferase complex dimerization subunit type 1 TsaB [Steroidobacteraceae bacterium]|nr:tRNA (adenosine(37)-N6)-threonylcarbamoyltransferase complex dimerization subunit type 1 TsaB [Steroidobacteraceae bacterium]
MKLLALDTATEACSVALLDGDAMLVRELPPGRAHAERILPLVQEVLAEAGTALPDLTAVAFGRGPGAFTGVRLAASVAQGLAFGAGLGVIPVSDLRAVAQQALQRHPAAAAVLVCNDARMREVYWACCIRGADGLAKDGRERVGSPQKVELPAQPRPLIGAGLGFSAYPELAPLTRELAAVELVLPRASEIALLGRCDLAAGMLLPPEQAVPVYLRDEVAQIPSRS